MGRIFGCYFFSTNIDKIPDDERKFIKKIHNIRVLCYMDNRRCDPVLLEAISRRLKQIRKEKGLSQRIVYIDTDIHIGKIESGKINVSISTIHRLCEYYGLTLEEFFRGIETR